MREKLSPIEEINKCPICLDSIYSKDGKLAVAALKPCGHCFHFSCIDTWLQMTYNSDKNMVINSGKQSARQVQCPYCRSDCNFMDKIKYDTLLVGNETFVTNRRIKKRIFLKFNYLWDLMQDSEHHRVDVPSEHMELKEGNKLHRNDSKHQSIVDFTRKVYLLNMEKERKKHISTAVRTILDPLYHKDKTITQTQYTQINKKVSRQLYAIQTSEYEMHAKALCEREIQNLGA